MEEVFHAIHYPISVGKSSGRLAEERDYSDYIRQLVIQVLMTAPGERIFRPEFGAGVRKMVFDVNSDGTASMARTLVYEALDRWLADYIKVDEVQTNAVESTLSIDVVYTIIARQERKYLQVEVTL